MKIKGTCKMYPRIHFIVSFFSSIHCYRITEYNNTIGEYLFKESL